MRIRPAADAAQKAAIPLAAIPTDVKNRALQAIADALTTRTQEIVRANQADLLQAKQDDLTPPLLKRLKFDEAKTRDVVMGIESLIGLEDPAGKTVSATALDQGLELYRVTCPIGVIGIIFESRPDALVQISTLCLKSGNTVLLKGGREATQTNRMLVDIIASATEQAGIPSGWIQLLETRAEVAAMLDLDDAIDLIIPRGSNEFVRYIMENTNIPVLGHADGICHVYVEAEADLDMAVKVTVDAKTQYVAVCNATETLLVDEGIAAAFLPPLQQALTDRQVEMRGCERTRQLIAVGIAEESDWRAEYLDMILSIKVVSGMENAIAHINRYGSGHTDAIVTRNPEKAAHFMNLVDSGNVFWNCSTRFSDGFRYGLGAEVGVSTNKIHARGPVGLDGLVIYKWKLIGSGQTVNDYSGPKAKAFTHQSLSQSCPL